MKRHDLIAIALLACTPIGANAQRIEDPIPDHVLDTNADQASSGPSELTFNSADGTELFADVYLPVGEQTPRALVLAFHMAGSNARIEYAPAIVPELLSRGLAVLTPDIRLGGTRLGGTNRTAAALEDAGVPELESYCDAYPDLVATLGFAEAWLAQTYPDAMNHDVGDAMATTSPIPIIVMGSSYTGTLVLRLAAEHPDRVHGVAAFSPAAGNSMAGCQPEDFYQQVTVPGLAALPERETHLPAKRHLLTNFRALGFIAHVEPGGQHGSRLLDVNHNTDDDASTVWAKVDLFLGLVIDD